MQRRVQRKPIRYVRQEVIKEKEQVSARAINIQDVVGIFSSLSGLMVAMLWIAGRYYTAAYFEAMNIPFSQISYSVWEYAGTAGPRLFFLIWEKSFLPLASITSALLSAFLFAFILQGIFPKLRFVEALRNMTTPTVRFPRVLRKLIALALILLLIFFLTQVAKQVSKTGSQDGQRAMLNKSYAVDVYSRNAIPLESSVIRSREQGRINSYRGLRLLTHNNGKYYLFREVDQATCRPKKVFVITDTQELYVVVKAIAPVRTLCIPTEGDP